MSYHCECSLRFSQKLAKYLKFLKSSCLQRYRKIYFDLWGIETLSPIAKICSAITKTAQIILKKKKNSNLNSDLSIQYKKELYFSKLPSLFLISEIFKSIINRIQNDVDPLILVKLNIINRFKDKHKHAFNDFVKFSSIINSNFFSKYIKQNLKIMNFLNNEEIIFEGISLKYHCLNSLNNLIIFL